MLSESALSVQHYRILIASPSDVAPERKALKDAFARWNKSHARPGVHLEPVMWETDSVPDSGSDPQSFINRDLGDCHAAIALLWTRIGTATPRALSGTIEEIESFLKAGKSVMLYVSVKPTNPQRLDAAQLGAVHNFVKGVEGRALYSSFKTPRQLENDLGSHLNTLADRLVKVGQAAVKGSSIDDLEAGQPDLAELSDAELKTYYDGLIRRKPDDPTPVTVGLHRRVLARMEFSRRGWINEEPPPARVPPAGPRSESSSRVLDLRDEQAEEKRETAKGHTRVAQGPSTTSSKVAKMKEEERAFEQHVDESSGVKAATRAISSRVAPPHTHEVGSIAPPSAKDRLAAIQRRVDAVTAPETPERRAIRLRAIDTKARIPAIQDGKPVFLSELRWVLYGAEVALEGKLYPQPTGGLPPKDCEVGTVESPNADDHWRAAVVPAFGGGFSIETSRKEACRQLVALLSMSIERIWEIMPSGPDE